ncbi:GNAT family N-acetyltransferase [Chloroflexales bacterium ZM16-3]|nr:GNAT family N-acetyltransferase [Chloroflexales bacterium ZM16-3]
MLDSFTQLWGSPADTAPGDMLAVEVAGQLAGGAAYRMAEGEPGLWLTGVAVLPERRRRGVGAQAYRALEDVLRRRGTRRLLAGVTGDSPAGQGFAARQGFEEVGGTITYQLDSAAADRAGWGDPQQLVAAQGLRLARLDRFPRRGLAERLLPLWNRTRPDQPQPWPFVPYSARRLEQEMLAPDAVALPHSFVIVTPSNQIIALALSAQLAADCLASIYLAVDPEFRGRGLALALKRQLIIHAQEQAIAALLAENDRRNCAMRAINQRLGYRPLSKRLVYQRALE